MIKTKDCEPLFDAFTAESLNAAQMLRDMGSIVQNDGVELTIREIEDWAEVSTHQLMKAHRQQLILITCTMHALKAMGKPVVVVNQ